MAHMATDGKKFTNRPPMMQHERSLSRMKEKSAAGGVGTMDPLKQPSEDGSGGEMGNDDPHAVVAEHGPAMETHTQHPEGEGPHIAMSMHPDGHEHRSEHKDGKSAHEHAMCLSGHCAHNEDSMGNQDEMEPEYE